MQNKIIDTYIEDNKEYTHYENGRLRIRTINEEPTRTDQTQKEQCDIKNIMKKYNNNLNAVKPLERGTYADLTQLPTYQQSLHILRDAQNSFDSLPSNIRKRFSNDPQEMISFLADPNNNEEAHKLGLKIKPEIPQQTEAEKYYANQNAKQKTAKTKPSTGNTDSDD